MYVGIPPTVNGIPITLTASTLIDYDYYGDFVHLNGVLTLRRDPPNARWRAILSFPRYAMLVTVEDPIAGGPYLCTMFLREYGVDVDHYQWPYDGPDAAGRWDTGPLEFESPSPAHGGASTY